MEHSEIAGTNFSDVSIVGGSIAGLLAAREAAGSGLRVSIFEEHKEIGIPEKCDGLVGAAGIARLGIVPPSDVIQNRILRATFYSPSMKEITVAAARQNVIVLDRSRFDKYLAEQAVKAGASIRVGARVLQYAGNASGISLKTQTENFRSSLLLDCAGYESYLSSGGKALQGGQYLACGNGFEKNTVEVYIDPVLYPGFFKWVIPLSTDLAKIGVAGDGINTFQILDDFAKRRGLQVLRKMAAPVLCFGTVREFVKGRMAKAGDSAGQAKPTTGGGIYTGGKGGILAGKACVSAIEANNVELLSNYERQWREEFGREFNLQSRARSFFSKLKPDQVDRLFEMISSSDIPNLISEEGDFDLHSTAIARAFGLPNILATFGMFFADELKDLVKFTN